MPDNPEENIVNQQNDPLLLKEEEKDLKILINKEQDNVSQSEKILGMIAYSKYSIQKYEFIRRQEQQENNSITKEAFKILIMSFNDRDSDALLSLKQSAKIILKDYDYEYLENAKRQEILDPI